jgi:hypothetical protein
VVAAVPQSTDIFFGASLCCGCCRVALLARHLLAAMQGAPVGWCLTVGAGSLA